jgi:hypothetical protein
LSLKGLADGAVAAAGGKSRFAPPQSLRLQKRLEFFHLSDQQPFQIPSPGHLANAAHRLFDLLLERFRVRHLFHSLNLPAFAPPCQVLPSSHRIPESHPSWQAFDRALAAVQLRAEAVCRNNRIVLDIISGAHPERRVSAYRVDQRFGPKTMQEKFGQTREEHERSQLIAHKRSHYRAWREEIAGDLQRQTHIQQEDFNRRYNAWRSRTEAHFQKADYIMVGEYIAYKVSEWLWERRRRKVERQQEAMRERAARAAAALRREEKQAVGEAASRHWAQLHAREERKRAARRQAEEKAQAQERQKQQDASKRRDKQFLEMYEEYKKAEDMLDRMALSRRAEAGEYGELTQRAYNLARHLTTSGAYWDRLKEQGADPIYIKKLQEFEQRQQRERTRDFGRGR